MSVVAASVLSLFALVFLGFFAGKANVVKQSSIPDFSSFIIKIAVPATVFLSVVEQQGKGMLEESVMIFPLVLLFHGVSFLIALAAVKIFRVEKKEQGVWLYSVMLPNNGFMGLPLANAVYGAKGMFVMALANIIMNIILFSIGTKLLMIGYETKGKLSLRQMFVNNINIAIAAGLVIYFLNIPMPDMLSDILGYVADITSGMSMIVVGMSLSKISVKGVFADRKMFIMVALRLAVIPLLVVAFFRVFSIEVDEIVAGVTLMTFSLPASVAQSMIAEQYGTNTAAAARSVFLTTLFSVVTVPIMMSLL